MKVVFLTNNFAPGGSERQIIRLAKALKRQGHEPICMSFSPESLDQEIRNLGIQLVTLNKKSKLQLPFFLFRLHREIKRLQPDIVYSFLITPMVYSALIHIFNKKFKLVWGLRTSNLDLYGPLTRIIFKISQWLYTQADLIVSNSHASKNYHQPYYPKAKIEVAYNGLDFDNYKIDNQLREKYREELGVMDEILLGNVSRMDSMKDYESFVRALAHLKIKCKIPFKAAFCFPRQNSYMQKIQVMVKQLNLTGYVLWVENHPDIPGLYNAFDIFCLTSKTESSPNALVEALACGRLAVCTDVGDCKNIVGNFGFISPAQDPEAFAENIVSAFSQLENHQPEATRLHCQKNHSVDTAINSHLQTLLST